MKNALINKKKLDELSRRFNAICPLLEFRHLRDKGYTPSLHKGREMLRSMEEIAINCADVNCVSRATIWDWYRRFLASGYEGLRKVERTDKGKSRFFETHPHAAVLVREMYIQKKTITQIRGELRAYLGSSNTPAYETVSSFLRTI